MTKMPADKPVKELTALEKSMAAMTRLTSLYLNTKHRDPKLHDAERWARLEQEAAYATDMWLNERAKNG